jgi:acyl carrier protein
LEDLERVRTIIADVTQNAVEEITENSNSKTVEGWDSVAQINIIVTVEMELGVSFTAEEMHSLDSIPKIMQALKLQAPA